MTTTPEQTPAALAALDRDTAVLVQVRAVTALRHPELTDDHTDTEEHR